MPQHYKFLISQKQKGYLRMVPDRIIFVLWQLWMKLFIAVISSSQFKKEEFLKRKCSPRVENSNDGHAYI
jgi:hypothetical protein